MQSILKSGLGIAAASMLVTTAFAQGTLTAETACPGGAPHTMITTLAEVSADKGIANLQVSDCQTLTNSLQNLVEGQDRHRGGTFHSAVFDVKRVPAPTPSWARSRARS